MSIQRICAPGVATPITIHAATAARCATVAQPHAGFAWEIVDDIVLLLVKPARRDHFSA